MWFPPLSFPNILLTAARCSQTHSGQIVLKLIFNKGCSFLVAFETCADIYYQKRGSVLPVDAAKVQICLSSGCSLEPGEEVVLEWEIQAQIYISLEFRKIRGSLALSLLPLGLF